MLQVILKCSRDDISFKSYLSTTRLYMLKNFWLISVLKNMVNKNYSFFIYFLIMFSDTFSPLTSSNVSLKLFYSL